MRRRFLCFIMNSAKAGSRARMNSSERLPAPGSRDRELLALSTVEGVESFFESFLRRVIWTHSRKDSKNLAIIMGQPTRARRRPVTGADVAASCGLSKKSYLINSESYVEALRSCRRLARIQLFAFERKNSNLVKPRNSGRVDSWRERL